MDQMLDQLKLFAVDQWYVLLIAAIVLILIIKIVKTMVKWVLVLVIAAGIVFYGANYTEAIKDVGGQILQYAKEEALQAMIGEAKEAQYSAESDGRFKVESRNVTIRGKVGEDEVEVTFKGQTVKFKMDETIRSYIEQAKGN